MGGGKTQTTTAKSTRDPYAPAKPGLQSILDQSASLSGNTDLFKPVQGAQTNQSLNQLEALGNQGSAAVQPLQNLVQQTGEGAGIGFGQLQATARGDNLNGNPYFNDALKYQLDDVRDRVNQEYSAAGRYGSNAHTEGLTDGLGQLSVNAMMNNYNQERGYQVNAADRLAGYGFDGANAAGQLDQANAYGANLLGQVGAQRDQHATAAQQAPLRALEYQNNMTVPIAGLGGTSDSTQEQKTPSNTFGQILGGGLTVAGLLAGGPAGAAAAGGFGGLTGGGGGFLSGLLGGGSRGVALNPWSSVVDRG